MEASASFNYAEYCRSKRSEKAPSTAKAPSTVRAPTSIQPPSTVRAPPTIKTFSTVSAQSTIMAPSEAGTEATEDNDHVYTYVAMREPDPAKDAQPVAYAYYPQYAYTYPAQQVVYQKEGEHVHAHAHHHDEEEERVRVRTRVVTKSPKPVAAVPAVAAQPAMMYAQPAGYTQPGGYAAYPYAYAMPNYPVPVHGTTSAKPIVTKEKHKPEKASRVWVGRTKKEVDEDNIKIAINEGIYNPNDIVPKGAKPDQLFWVIETDDTNTLRTFQTIDSGSLGQGVWKIDPRHGNAYFVRAREEKK